ncbi:MAG: adenylate/guanylate cyclase domain-containing protein [Tildeniella nuda ZEHNDER 1965/U140]|nr:adenylate/guanylate cyclase domain-containing protein [Tildeniella nuda ZEHNDER 1965/U140]
MWDQLKRQLWQWRGVLITAPSVTIFVLALRFTGLLELLEMAALDQFFQLRPQEAIDSRIVIVELNEPEIQKLDWPASDAVLARLINNVKKQQPSAIGLDFYRDKPVGLGYQEFVKVCESTPYLIGVQKVAEQIDSHAVNPPPVLKQRDQVGVNDFPLDRDGKVRRGLIYVSPEEGDAIFSFAFKLADLHLKAQGISVGLTKDDLVKVGPAVLPLFQSSDGGYVRAEDQGYQVLLNYRGSIQRFPTLSMVDVLENRIPPDSLRGRIVLLGPTAESLKDLFYTPYSSSLFTSTRRMPGVVIHANSISQILSAALEDRPFIRTWGLQWESLWIFGWALIGATLSWRQRYSGSLTRRSPWTTAGIALAALGLVVGSYLAFLAGWWIPLVPPILALTGSAIVVTAYIARSAGEIRKAFGRFVTSEIVANLLENPEGLKLGGERRKITILTSDIRGFTAISERLPPEEVIRIINLYLGYMADVITSYQGTIDEFMGDGILVLFGAPTAREDDAVRAIACALAMQLAMEPVNEKMRQLGLPQLEMGIGINTGEVVVGNIGSETRTKYGIVGDQVNLTYRVESYTVGGQIFTTEATLKEVGSTVITDGQREVQPKGVHDPIMIYEVVGMSGKYNLHLTKEEEIFFDLPHPMVMQYATLDGKQIDRTVVKGKLVRLSAKEAEVRLDEAHAIPAPLTNLKLNLYIPQQDSASSKNYEQEKVHRVLKKLYSRDAQEADSSTETSLSEDVYAKVLERPAEKHSFYIRFTNRPLDVEAQLNAIYQSLQPTGD